MKRRIGTTAGAIGVTRALLRRWPLPLPGSSGDKEDRGRLLIIAGSTAVPGAAVLSVNAALRSGVGKVTVATEAPHLVAQVVPEALVLPFRAKRTSRQPAGHHDTVGAVLIGPGMEPSPALRRCIAAALRMDPAVTIVLDAGALTKDLARRLDERVPSDTPRCVLTPHAGEMATLLGVSKNRVEADADSIALEVSARLSLVLVLKGAITRIASAGRLWRLTGNNIGLAVSGSGDTLAGIIAALAARGAPAEQAAVWGVALHAYAGETLARRYGPVGALAREIPDEIPRLMAFLSRRRHAP